MISTDAPERAPGVEPVSFLAGPHCGDVWNVNVWETELRPAVFRTHATGGGLVRTTYGLAWCFCHGFRYIYVPESEDFTPKGGTS